MLVDITTTVNTIAPCIFVDVIMPLGYQIDSLSPISVLQKVRLIRRELERYSSAVESRLGLTSTQLGLLVEVYNFPGARVTDIGERMGIHQTTASNVLAQMVKKGLIEKVPAGEDRRGICLKATRAGKKLVESQEGPLAMRARWNNLFAKLDPLALRQMNDSMTLLLDVISEFAEENYGFDVMEAAES